jgi:ribosomal protein S18 acetylase RimI-like enzyme
MAPAWAIRAAGPEDAPALALVGAATFLETFAGTVDGGAIVRHCARVHSAEAYARQFRDGASAFLATTAPGDAPVGYALLGRPDLPGAADGDIELKRIYALSRFHGSGLGNALMAAALAAAAGHRRLALGVYRGNARALAFYARHGFATVGERRFDVGGIAYDDLVLARPLSIPALKPR